MKRILSAFLVIAAVFALCVPGLAAEGTQRTYTLTVSGKTIDLEELPVAPYEENGTVMVPLRKVGEALGYKVDWNAETKAITVDDEYIQKATLFEGTATVVFEGRLKIINMSREMENVSATVVHNGYTYVPLDFFREFLNDAEVVGDSITIAPSKSELCTDIS